MKPGAPEESAASSPDADRGARGPAVRTPAGVGEGARQGVPRPVDDAPDERPRPGVQRNLQRPARISAPITDQASREDWPALSSMVARYGRGRSRCRGPWCSRGTFRVLQSVRIADALVGNQFLERLAERMAGAGGKIGERHEVATPTTASISCTLPVNPWRQHPLAHGIGIQEGAIDAVGRRAQHAVQAKRVVRGHGGGSKVRGRPSVWTTIGDGRNRHFEIGVGDRFLETVSNALSPRCRTASNFCVRPKRSPVALREGLEFPPIQAIAGDCNAYQAHASPSESGVSDQADGHGTSQCHCRRLHRQHLDTFAADSGWRGHAVSRAPHHDQRTHHSRHVRGCAPGECRARLWWRRQRALQPVHDTGGATLIDATLANGSVVTTTATPVDGRCFDGISVNIGITVGLRYTAEQGQETSGPTSGAACIVRSRADSPQYVTNDPLIHPGVEDLLKGEIHKILDTQIVPARCVRWRPL